MLTPNPSVVPPGGFHFVDTTGPSEVRTDGYGYDDVAQKVLQNRLQNGRPPGNPSQEVLDYVCGNWPHFCRESRVIPSPDVGAGASPYQGLASRCATWIADFFQAFRADAGVPVSVSQHRADTCCACPRNQEFRGGCGSCGRRVWQAVNQVPAQASGRTAGSSANGARGSMGGGAKMT